MSGRGGRDREGQEERKEVEAEHLIEHKIPFPAYNGIIFRENWGASLHMAFRFCE